MNDIDDRLTTIAASQPYPLLFATVSGAHLYGFPSPDSDYDLRGVHVLPVQEVVGLEIGPETLEVAEERDGLELDLVTHDVKKFFGLLLRKNGYVLEQLYSPLMVQTTPEHEELKAIATGCITRYHSHHYLGFAETQWKLFMKEHPRRVKPLLYVFRVLLTGIHLMRTGEVEANLVTLNESFKLPYVPDLIARKLTGPEQSVLDGDDVSLYEAEYLRLRAALEIAAAESTLPETSTAKPALHDLLVRVRMKFVAWTGVCPVCGLEGIGFPDIPGSFNLCPRCGWEDDSAQFIQPDLEGGANQMSLQQARAAWGAGKQVR
jgi:predicted nucleotidyltransferase